MKRGSLTARVLLFASVWAVIALVAIAIVISQLYRAGSERAFADLLRAHLNSVINAVTVDADGHLAGNPQLGDLVFDQPGSGWIWLVEPLGALGGPRLASISIGAAAIGSPAMESLPFNERYQRHYRAEDDAGNPLEVVETEVELDNQGHAARFRVAGNRQVLEAEIAAFSTNLYLVLTLFGLGSLLVNAVAILYGLRPLDQARQALGRIRAGEAHRLDGTFPREIAPLAAEINALIEANQRVIERARMQVGNLAHSLKTPIAVLINESRDMTPSHASLVRTQAETMQAQVQTYLDRARIAAQRGSVLARTEAAPVIERLLRVMAKLNPELSFSSDIEPRNALLAMETQDLEEALGNLVENAAKFARREVVVRVRMAPACDAPKPMYRIAIEDDGPGLDEDGMREAIKRGRRLDESKPGTGLGLSIVGEIASEYEGTFALAQARSGGLSAQLTVPALITQA
ncbi:HAMP domain-containing sensor histidine kinase [Hoeflea sp. YIM 152468]|uniref:ATP-binding protein n=1 Tax=Hoeflea sp. YIM 152468 TaxID=3031759 RepID=UPI0023DCA1AB|nr:HAMP domain-containing sensor histidine kinase [Hoeflea sp. YIM 152468]MDF1607267.1 HAMP domain-containing sensor histidine kinase [Hoeflea sp. YIM 152468]